MPEIEKAVDPMADPENENQQLFDENKNIVLPEEESSYNSNPCHKKTQKCKS